MEHRINDIGKEPGRTGSERARVGDRPAEMGSGPARMGRGQAKVEIAPAHRGIRRARTLGALAILGWFVAACVGGLFGVVDRTNRPPLALLAYIAIPNLGFIAAYRFSRSFRAFANGLDMSFLVGSHLWRFVGLGFIIAWLRGRLPAGFAIPEGSGDIIAAAGALALLPALRKRAASRGWLLAWNVWGFIDLVSAITMGILYSDGPLGILHGGGVTTRPMVTFPVSLIPTFFVPLFILIHLLTFKKIAETSAPLMGVRTGDRQDLASEARVERMAT